MPKSDIYDEPPVIQPPSSITVEQAEPKPLLYDAEGKALTKDRRIGFVRGGNAVKVGPHIR